MAVMQGEKKGKDTPVLCVIEASGSNNSIGRCQVEGNHAIMFPLTKNLIKLLDFVQI